MIDFIGWGPDKKWHWRDSNITGAPPVTKDFYKGIAFEIEPEKEEKTITVMETNEAGEEVEVTKKVMVDVVYPKFMSKQWRADVF